MTPGHLERGTFRCGRLLGIELRVHVLFPVLIAYLTGVAWWRDGIDAAATTGGFLGVLAASLLLHELGHGVASRLLSVRVTGITLTPMGGATWFEGRPTREAPIALAGPAASALVALAAGAALVLVDGGWPELAGLLEGQEELGRRRELLRVALLVNAAMAAVNMLPAFPLDGGRVMRAALTGGGRDDAAATRAVAGVGYLVVPAVVVVAVLVVGPAVLRWQAGWVVALVAAFVIHQAGRAELAHARRDEDDDASGAAVATTDSDASVVETT